MPIPPDLNDDPPPLPPADLDAFVTMVVDLAQMSGVSLGDSTHAHIHADERPAAASWEPTDLAGAEWCARKLADARERIAGLRDCYETWKSELDVWLADVTKRDEVTALLMESKLEAFALEQRAAGGPATLKLPSGQVRTVKHSTKVTMPDAAAALAWALERIPCPRCEGRGLVPDGAAVPSPEECGHCDNGWIERHPDIVQRKEWVNVTDVRAYVEARTVPTGRFVMDLECGCTLTDSLPDELAERVTDDGRLWVDGRTVRLLCPTHGAEQAIAHIVPETKLQPVEVGPGGATVDVLSVEPEHVTATVA